MTTITSSIASSSMTIPNPELCLSLPLLPAAAAAVAAEDPLTAAARMNRKHKLRAKQGSDDTTNKKLKQMDNDDNDAAGTHLPLAAIPGVKQGARYEPDVPMSRAELAQWRKLARRVRNRESAAASREKTRQRIDELEHALAETNRKYQAALQKIAQLEQTQNSNNQTSISTAPFVPDPLPSIIHTNEPATAVSPPLSPRDSLSLELDDDNDYFSDLDLVRPILYQQSMISRPTAD